MTASSCQVPTESALATGAVPKKVSWTVSQFTTIAARTTTTADCSNAWTSRSPSRGQRRRDGGVVVRAGDGAAVLTAAARWYGLMTSTLAARRHRSQGVPAQLDPGGTVGARAYGAVTTETEEMP